MDNIGYIYKIVSPSNKIYIGQTINPYNRVCHYKKMHCKKQCKLYASLCKHGWINHTFEIIETIDREELNSRESYWIEYYDSFNNGLNLTTGGDSCKRSKETCEKISKSKMGDKNYMFGRIGELHHRYNQKASSETIEKLKTSHLGKMKGRDNGFFKGMIQCYKDGVFIGEFEGIHDAANKLGLHHPNISKVLKGKRNTTGGYTFSREQTI